MFEYEVFKFTKKSSCFLYQLRLSSSFSGLILYFCLLSALAFWRSKTRHAILSAGSGVLTALLKAASDISIRYISWKRYSGLLSSNTAILCASIFINSCSDIASGIAISQSLCRSPAISLSSVIKMKSRTICQAVFKMPVFYRKLVFSLRL